MSLTNIYRGSADPDVAFIDTSGGLTFYCWIEHAATVKGQLLVTHEQGQQTLVWEGVIGTAAANHTVDSTRCVQCNDRYFVVYWLDYDTSAGTFNLESRYADMSALDSAMSWTAMSDIVPDDAGLYDVKQIEGTGEYMLAWTTSTTQTIVRRVSAASPPDHTSSVAWSTTATTNHADRILAVHADADAGANNGGAWIVYQNTTNDLVTTALDHSDGTELTPVTVYSSTSAEFCAVGIAKRPGTTDAAIIAEFAETDAVQEVATGFTITNQRSAHYIVMVLVDENGDVGSNTHVVPNLNMLSKPYGYTDASGSAHIYCGLGYKTVRYPGEWSQHVGFVCDMGMQHWGDTANTIRPRPVLTRNLSNIDSDAHAASPETDSRVAAGIGKRMNHLSNWIPGPSSLCDVRKSRTVAWAGWSRQQVTEDGTAGAESSGTLGNPVVLPRGAKVTGVVHYLEDPWTTNRDALDPAQPLVNFHGGNPLSLYDNGEARDSMLVAGGTPQLYDGKAIVELGFPWVPEIVDVEDEGDVADIAAGSYRYIAVYEWTDAKGQLHRSGHGLPYTHTHDGTSGASVIVRTLTIGNRDASWIYPQAQQIQIAIYRTHITASNRFFRLHSSEQVDATYDHTPQGIPVNDPSAWAIKFKDGLRNLALINAQELTFVADGGQQNQFPPHQPPAAHAVANWKNRVWLASSEEPKDLWYSYPMEGTAATGKLAPEFTPFFIFRLDAVLGDVTSLQPMDDALIVFTRDGIYSLTGDGNVGIDATTSTLSLQVLHEGTGCIEPRSVALTPAGILFQSYKGMYLLDKGGQLDFISTGAAIEDLLRTSGNVRSGDHLPDRHLVAFVANDAVADGPMVIKYDYYHRMWSTSDLEPPNSTTWLSSTASGCVWRANERDASHVVLCQGNLLVERGKDDATPYRDENDVNGAEEIRLDIETGWISLAGIAGYKRVREIGVQTEVVGTADNLYAELDVDATGDFSLSSPETHQFTDPPGYVRIRPLTPKMSSFRLRLYEPAGVAVAENRKITGIAVHVGRKKGPRKVPDAQQG